MDELINACREAENTIRCAVTMLEIRGSIGRPGNLETFRLRLNELRGAIAKANTSITFPIPNGLNPNLHS